MSTATDDPGQVPIEDVDALTLALKYWCERHRLPYISADELMAQLQRDRDALSERYAADIKAMRERMDWLAKYIALWDATV